MLRPELVLQRLPAPIRRRPVLMRHLVILARLAPRPLDRVLAPLPARLASILAWRRVIFRMLSRKRHRARISQALIPVSPA